MPRPGTSGPGSCGRWAASMDPGTGTTLNMCPRASRWTRRPSRSSSVSRSSAYSPGTRYLGRADHARRVDLGREVPGVGQDHAVAQQREIGGGQHVPGAGDSDDEVRVGDGGIARRRAEPVQVRPEPGYRVDVDDGHPGVGAAEVSRHPAPARPVAEHGDLLPVGGPVRHPQEGFDRALPDGVLVLRELLDRAVVDDQDRPPEPAAPGAAWTSQRTAGHDRFRAGIYFRTQAPVLPVRPSAVARRRPGQLEALYLRGGPGGGRTRPRHGSRAGLLPGLP
jgi:hypothetical protein